jgi:signal peptidase
MSLIGLNGSEFRALTEQLLAEGHRVRFQASGESMQPFIQDKDILEVAPLEGKQIKKGDVMLVETDEGRLLAHRVVKINRNNGIPIYFTRGDSSISFDGSFRLENILGRVEIVERGNLRIILTSDLQRQRALLWIRIMPLVSRFSWLPEGFRRRVRDWLTIS